jgi:hypothetical protein
MNKLLYAEEVLELCLNQISLSRYDKKFFYNLQLLNVLPRKSITSNQAELFKKVVLKYHSQLLKKQYNSIELSELPWQLTITQSSPDFTNAQFQIKDGTLVLRCPYKQQFIKDFKSLQLMNWHGADKCYYSKFGLDTFRKVNDVVMKYYQEISYCNDLKDIIHEVSKYEGDCIWDPTLVESNGRYYIAAINEPLFNAIEGVEFKTDFYSLSKITSYGIKIDKKLHNTLNDTQARFISNHEYKHEHTEIDSLIALLKEIKCDQLLVGTRYGAWNNSDDMLKAIANSGIPVIHAGDQCEYLSFSMPVFLKFNSFSYKGYGSMFAAKVIHVVNSTEIEIK